MEVSGGEKKSAAKSEGKMDEGENKMATGKVEEDKRDIRKATQKTRRENLKPQKKGDLKQRITS